jgi:hypothetical protein
MESEKEKREKAADNMIVIAKEGHSSALLNLLVSCCVNLMGNILEVEGVLDFCSPEHRIRIQLNMWVRKERKFLKN